MTDFITADLHLGHRKILELQPQRQALIGSTTYPTTSQDHDDAILAHLADLLRPRGHHRLYVLGDLFLTSRSQAHTFVHHISNLARQLLIVPGNHDGPLLARLPLPTNTTILPPIHTMNHNGYGLVMCHYPLESWPGMHRRPDASPGQLPSSKRLIVHLHGHSHGRLTPKPHRLDVGPDATGRLLLPLDEAIQMALLQ